MAPPATPNAEDQRRIKLAAWREHVQDIDQRMEQFRSFDAQIKAWLDTVTVNIHTQIHSWLAAMEAHRKAIQTRIDAGL